MEREHWAAFKFAWVGNVANSYFRKDLDEIDRCNARTHLTSHTLYFSILSLEILRYSKIDDKNNNAMNAHTHIFTQPITLACVASKSTSSISRFM